MPSTGEVRPLAQVPHTKNQIFSKFLSPYHTSSYENRGSRIEDFFQPNAQVRLIMGDVQYRVSRIEYPVSGIQYRVSSIEYPVSSIQYRVSRIEYPESSIQNRVSSAQKDLNLQNKPNLLNAQMTYVLLQHSIMKMYRFTAAGKTKPIQSQSKPIQTQFKPNQTRL